MNGHGILRRAVKGDGKALRNTKLFSGSGINTSKGYVVDRDRRNRVVVGDGADALAVADRRACNIEQVHKEQLVAFINVVAIHDHSDRLASLVRKESEVAAGAVMI